MKEPPAGAAELGAAEIGGGAPSRTSTAASEATRLSAHFESIQLYMPPLCAHLLRDMFATKAAQREAPEEPPQRESAGCWWKGCCVHFGAAR